MAWVISFIISWIIFFLLADYRRLKVNIINGILAVAIASFVDWGGQRLGLYEFNDIIIPWAGCSAFYKFGPILTMGILFPQTVKSSRWLQLVNIIIISLLYFCVEILIVMTGTAEYIHWHPLASLVVDFLTFATMTWFTLAFLKKDIPPAA